MTFQPLVVQTMSNIRPVPVDWLWPQRIARGKLSILAGDPGLGKSFLTVDIAARVSRGASVWPDGSPGLERGRVLLVSAEDDPADTIRPRLDAAGADCDRIRIIEAAHDKRGCRTAFNLRDHLDGLRGELKNNGGYDLLVIDPIASHVGNIDSHVNAQVRAVLSPLQQLAAELRVAVLAVHHLNKGGNPGANAISRLSGSGAFGAAARSVMLVVKDPNEESRRIVACVKSNVGHEWPGLAFAISGDPAGVVWDREPVLMTADELLRSTVSAEGGSRLSEAIQFLREYLKDGPQPASEVESAAKVEGISVATLRRAKKVLGVRSPREGFGPGGTYVWTLDDPRPASMDHMGAHAPSGDIHGTDEQPCDTHHDLYPVGASTWSDSTREVFEERLAMAEDRGMRIAPGSDAVLRAIEEAEAHERSVGAHATGTA